MQKIAILKRLLDSALESTEIRDRSQLATRYSVESYGQALREIRQQYVPHRRFALLRYEIVIQDHRAHTNLLNLLRVLLGEHVHEDRIQTALFSIHGGGVVGGYSIELLGKRLLQLALIHGPGTAAALFVKSLEDQECEYQSYTLLGGIRIDSTLGVYDGVRLILLSQKSVELPGYLPAMFGDVHLQRFLGGTLIAEDMTVSPRYINPTHFSSPARFEENGLFNHRHKSTEVPFFNLSEFCNALSMVTKTRVFASVSWKHVSEDEVASFGEYGNGYGWSREPAPMATKVITGQQVREAKGVYESLTSLRPDDRARLSVPIDRLVASWGGKGHVDQVIDLAIALESLYLPEFDSELSYRLRNRGARFLGTDLPQRKTLAAQLRSFYKVRSKAVHTGKIPDSHKIDGHRVDTAEFIGMIQELCLRSIRQVLDDGFPDWEDLELG